MTGGKALGQRRLTGACLGRQRNDPSPALAGKCECIVQSLQLFFTLEQIDSGIPIICCLSTPIVPRPARGADRR
jgi:hypothetical protein